MNTFYRVFLGAALVGAGVLASCASEKAAETAESGVKHETAAPADFSAVVGRDWQLMEVNAGEQFVLINRDGNQMPDVYTLRFGEDGRASGKAAPNTYTGPYESEGSSLRFPQPLASTRMLGLSASPGLQEDVYYGYLSRASSWSLLGALLFITSKTEDGQPTTLVFAPIP